MDRDYYFLPRGFVEDKTPSVTSTSVDYKIYLESIFNLAKTIVIKSEEAAELINSNVALHHGEQFVGDDKTQWKYYLHVSGEYHFTDTAMHVVSLDTMETIVFSKETLKKHTTTRAAYEYGTRYYYSLIKQYPEQEDLVLGILHPADISKAITAEDHSVLSYPLYLVEPQEITLIQDLNAWLKRYHVRWHVKAFRMSDDYYPIVQQALLYLQLVPQLLNLRFRRIRTNEVHSFHIKAYLESNGKLGKYIPFLTLDQQLFLYRNISYLERNAGHEDTFEWLIERLLTRRRIPLVDVTVKHLDVFDDSLAIQARVRKKQLNTVTSGSPITETVESIVKRQLDTYGSDTDVTAEEINTDFKMALSDTTKTKTLESIQYSYAESEPTKLMDVLISQWVYMSTYGTYRTYVHITHPVTLLEYSFLVKDAFILFLFLSHKYLGIELEIIPRFIAKNIHFKTITDDHLKAVINPSVLTLEQARTLSESLPLVSPIISPSAFLEHCKSIHKAMLSQWLIISSESDQDIYANLKNTSQSFYKDESVSLTAETDMVEWLNSKGFSAVGLQDDDVLSLLDDIFTKATGYRPDVKLSNTLSHKALISLFTRLSSYSVHVLSGGQSDDVTMADSAPLRTAVKDVSTNINQKLSHGVNVLGSLTSFDNNAYIGDYDKDVRIHVSQEGITAIAINEKPTTLTSTLVRYRIKGFTKVLEVTDNQPQLFGVVNIPSIYDHESIELQGYPLLSDLILTSKISIENFTLKTNVIGNFE